MLVKDYMTRHPIMISPETDASEAQNIMTENNIRHLPVVGDGKRLLGLITREKLHVPPSDLGSLNVWEISRLLSDLKVKGMMVKGKDLITTEGDITIEDAAKIMLEEKIGCLPVLEDGVVGGIITDTDMLAHLAHLMGATVQGVRVTIRMPDKVGESAKVTDVIASHGWGIYGGGGHDAPKQPGYWDAVLKIQGGDKEEVVAALEQIEGQEIIDVR
ncbi:MAG: Inosine-5'-monophosphate dehydrogenase [Chloroflexi bacterium]|nr:Inosine-5'-monophosphate dehydrogenase [Chloroflexota bacterium]